MEGLSVGRIVHFKSPRGVETTCRAAMIVRVWGDNGTVNLTLFPDWSNDNEPSGIVWKTSIQHESQLPEGHTSDSWHWPEKV